MMQRSDALPALLKIGEVDARRSLVEIKWSHAQGDVLKVGYFFDIPASLKLSLYTVMT